MSNPNVTVDFGTSEIITRQRAKQRNALVVLATYGLILFVTARACLMVHDIQTAAGKSAA